MSSLALPNTLAARGRRPSLAAGVWIAMAAAFATVLLLVSPVLAEFYIPPLKGYVADTSGQLAAGDVRDLNVKLDAFHRDKGFVIVAFVCGSLQGQEIEDVAYKTFNTWKVGNKDKDDGVLLMIAPHERRVRIETGKGVGGVLTDLQSNDIIRQVITPNLQANRLSEALDEGTDAIAKVLAADPTRNREWTKRSPAW